MNAKSAFMAGVVLCTAWAASPCVAAWVVDPDSIRVESEAFQPPPCSAAGKSFAQPQPVSPVIEASRFGAVGDGVTDDSDAIGRALDSLHDGGTLRLEPGRTYLKRKIIKIIRPGVRLWGYGATVKTVTTEEEVGRGKGQSPLSIYLLGPRTGIYGLTIISNLRTRLVGHPNDSAIYMAGPGQEAIDNRIEYTGVGVLLEGASDFLVARNTVFRTTADGIHMTNGSRHGRVLCNIVRETGDDMIAVVNYGTGPPSIGDFLIEQNDVAGQYAGRGISVVGGRNVTIRSNRISQTTAAAGIYIASESSWNTASVEDVLVEENWISEVQTTAAAYNPISFTRKTGHGAVHIQSAGPPHQIENVVVRDNHVERTLRDGIYIAGNVRRVGIDGNQTWQTGRHPIYIEAPGPEQVGCRGNAADGNAINPEGCEGDLPSAKGASW